MNDILSIALPPKKVLIVNCTFASTELGCCLNVEYLLNISFSVASFSQKIAVKHSKWVTIYLPMDLEFGQS